jgi:hypothetical protein
MVLGNKSGWLQKSVKIVGKAWVLKTIAGYEDEKTIVGHHANGCPQCWKSLSKSHCNSTPITIGNLTQTPHEHIKESRKGNLICKRDCWIYKEP